MIGQYILSDAIYTPEMRTATSSVQKPPPYHKTKVTLDSNILPIDPFWDDGNIEDRLNNVMIKTINLQGGLIVNEIEVVLKPFLIYNIKDYADSYLTGISTIDNVITERIKKDYTNISRIADYATKYDKHYRNTDAKMICSDYQFKNGLIYLKLHKSNNEPFNKHDYKAIKNAVEIYDNGPETWMEDNIIIYEGPELAKTGKKFIYDKYLVELAIDIVDITPHIKNFKL